MSAPTVDLRVALGAASATVSIELAELSAPVVELLAAAAGWERLAQAPSTVDVIARSAPPSHVAMFEVGPVDRADGSGGGTTRMGTSTELVVAVCDAIEAVLASRLEAGVLLHAGAAVSAGSGVLVLGESKAGKSTMAAALAASGWSHATDELVLLDADGAMHGFPRPLHLRPEAPRPAVAATWPGIPGGRFDVLRPPHAWVGAFDPRAAVVLDRHVGEGPVTSEALTAASLARTLIDSSFNAYRRAWHGIATLASLAAELRGVRVRYGEAEEAVPALDAARTGTGTGTGAAAGAGRVEAVAVAARRGVMWCYDDSVLVVDGDRARVLAVAGGPGFVTAQPGHEMSVAPLEVEGVVRPPAAWLAAVDDAFGGRGW